MLPMGTSSVTYYGGTLMAILGNAVSNTYSCPQATGIGNGRTWVCSVVLYGANISCNVTYNVTFSSGLFSYNAVYISGTCPGGRPEVIRVVDLHFLGCVQCAREVTTAALNGSYVGPG